MVFSSYRRLAFAIATCLAVLLVFLPTSVASIRAAIQQSSTTGSGEEQHEETDARETKPEAKEARAEQSARPHRHVTSTEVVRAPHRALISVAAPIHPSQYSVRRLL